MRARRSARRASRKEVRGSRFDVAGDDRRPRRGLRARAGRERRVPHARPKARACRPTTTPGARPRTGVFAAGDAVTGSQSVIHAVAGGKRTALAIDAWLRGEDLAELEGKLAVFNGLPYLDQLTDDEPKLGELGQRLAERTPGVAQDGRDAPNSRLAPPCPRSARSSALSATDVEVEKGFGMAAAQAEASAACSATCPSLGACELQTPRRGVRHHQQRPGRQGRPRARRCSPTTSIRSSGATWTAASPAAAACGCAATWPVRPATTSPAAAST